MAERVAGADRFELGGSRGRLRAGRSASALAREAMAGLRIAAIMAHQGFVGIEFVNGPADPAVFNLLGKSLSGALTCPGPCN